MKLNLQWDGGSFTGVRTEQGIFFNLCQRTVYESQFSGKIENRQGVKGNMEITFGVPQFADVDREFERRERGSEAYFTAEDRSLRTSHLLHS
ncbi:hypothetical protein [Paenibacillus sp. PK3_47]|uniref:hypothetical protein n=1 Tax=Paenibacillus sp. PK3_47 TaxID=2072642 RepID=UPI00201DD376|nr:hypothetical protein [Paenibacillus sp. PK3_47]